MWFPSYIINGLLKKKKNQYKPCTVLQQLYILSYEFEPRNDRKKIIHLNYLYSRRMKIVTQHI